jgi:hypothetical protein
LASSRAEGRRGEAVALLDAVEDVPGVVVELDYRELERAGCSEDVRRTQVTLPQGKLRGRVTVEWAILEVHCDHPIAETFHESRYVVSGGRSPVGVHLEHDRRVEHLGEHLQGGTAT